MMVRLNGITFTELPYITKGEEVTVIRENGKPWDSEARPAYSIRLGGLHIGYIPLIETEKEVAIKARDGFKKVWKEKYAVMNKEEVREAAIRLNESDEPESMFEWKPAGREKMRELSRNKFRECECLEVVRDWLYVDIMRNHSTPVGHVFPLYYDEEYGRNTDEVGEICSISVRIDDIW